MINITALVVSQGELIDKLKQLIFDRYKVTADVADSSIAAISDYVKSFCSPLWFVIEHPYVDKFYRDTYYNYYSSKLGDYSRDSIRVSVFSEEISDEQFRSENQVTRLRNTYLGFFTIRPTFPSVIGRSVLSPYVFQNNNFVCCKTGFNVTANGVKFNAIGFPHSSQDAETITCAETTIWSIVEYFSHKYPIYKPVLPSHINAAINRYSVERLIPSKGLTATLVSYALKEFGFSVKIYAKNAYGADFDLLLKTYIESGIPIVGAMSNNLGIGHAFNIIGREVPSDAAIDSIPVAEIANDGNLHISDYYTMPLNYVFIDDNYPPYQMTTINNPSGYYTNPKWQGCEISMFIAPLYPKIYLEADTARKLANSYIKRFQKLGIFTRTEVIAKTFLTSSRSYKEYIALKSGLEKDAQELLMSTSLPKFIWVTELSDKDHLKHGKCFGVILLDATEPKQEGVVATLLEGTYLSYDFSKFEIIDIPLHPFSVYNSNLK
ncbi:hypothetical protein [Mucilaginibacter celer]|uniref:Uncharacterized protein n=1 Tax=Mucilaginibacter celer TaxID=2305508 RepID=A0A494VQB4_9SPHI|nr:hypothetical protein [Mucilaginibacter celer]AYL96529.1 hypothetical protein HYN43_015015 [Mucilaginibacter celer]